MKHKDPRKSPGYDEEGRPKSFAGRDSVKEKAEKGEFRKKDGTKQLSNWGKRNPVVDQSRWRKQLDGRRVKFDDAQKGVYLEALANHGRRGDAAKAANVTNQTVVNHLNIDPDFAEAVEHAEQEYRDKFVGHAMNLALEGVEVRRYNKDGALVESRREYPIKLIEMELKRIESGYRDHRTIDVNENRRGVLVVPTGQSIDDWAANQGVKVMEADESEYRDVTPGNPEDKAD